MQIALCFLVVINLKLQIELVVQLFIKFLLERYKNEEGFVIAGTSAGAMAMANEMIAGGSPQKPLLKVQ